MDIKFSCPRCGQSISMDEKGAGVSVQCPACNFKFSVSTKDAEKLPSLPQPDRAAETEAATRAEDPVITRRSGWSPFLQVVGILFIVVGIIGFAAEWRRFWKEDSPDALICLAIGAAGAIQYFFFAFLIDVFTDIRWFLKKLVDGRNG